MAGGLTLDAGALIAADQGDRVVWTYCKEAVARGAAVTVPAAALAQAWRAGSPLMAKLLAACEVEVLDELAAKRAAELLAKRGTSDVVAAAVVLGAIAREDAILTSDPDDIRRLVAAARSKIRVLSL